jgi:spermidine/putrescine-binding protein
LNFLCRDDIAEANFDYVYYASPVLSVVENQDADVRENEAINPSEEILRRCEVYIALDDAETERLSNLWQTLKTN